MAQESLLYAPIFAIALWQEILQLEQLCKSLYETTDPGIRNEAEKALVDFPNSPDCLAKCQLLLERAAVRCSLQTCHKLLLLLYRRLISRVSSILDSIFSATWS